MWQTIDTAPKDGTQVLLFNPNGTKICFGYYYDTETFQYGISQTTSQGWVLTNGSSGWATPTHWMPMPADPA